MSTALQIIQDSLKKIGVLAAGETLSSEEASDGLRSLNSMLSGWNTQRLIMTGIAIEEFTLVAAQSSYTLGAGGDFNTSVPISTDAAYVRYNDGSEVKVKIVDNKVWGSIVTKNSDSSIPTHLYIDYNFPLQKVYLYPVPSEANTLILHNYRKLAAFASLTTAASLPDGYERAIIYNLAIELAPDYGKTIGGEISKIANESFANIKRVNIKPRTVKCDAAVIGSGGHFNWRTGE